MALIARRIKPVFLAAPLMILVLVVYCEFSSIVARTPAPGLEISGTWALRIAFGWIVLVAALPHLAPRIARLAIAAAHPWLTATACVVAMATFTLGCEWLMSAFSDRWSSAFGFLYARLPMHLAVSALLLALFARRSVKPKAGDAPEIERGPVARTAPATLEVMTGTGHTSIRLEDIEWFKAERNYVNVIHRSGRTYLLRRTMTALQEGLDPDSFVRVHRSIIVNRRAIRERRPGDVLVLHSGASVRISRAYRGCL